MQIVNSVPLLKEIIGKNVKITVAFNGIITGGSIPKDYEGVVSKVGFFADEHFFVLEDGTMINMKYVQTIEFIK